MKTLLQFAAALALLVLSVGAAVLTEDAHEFILHRDNELKAMFADADLVTKHAYASLTALDGATQKASGVLDEMKCDCNGSRVGGKSLAITSAAETAVLESIRPNRPRSRLGTCDNLSRAPTGN